MNFLYNVYMYQAMVIVVASILGITKDKFLMERSISDQEKQTGNNYPVVLKSKLNPHFLFSTLNTIHDASFTCPTKTSDSILQLSRLLHYHLYDSEKEKITVAQELSSVQALASLYQLKYNHQLNLAVDVQGKNILDRIEIPSSLFLNLFQTALKHSEIGENPEGFIRISCKADHLNLFYEINCRGKGESTSDEKSARVTSDSAVIHILENYFPEKFDFFSEQGDDYYKTIIKIDLND
ncbi:histidine kinase [Chryseobacterium sp. CBSDS_008]|uniref:histidine kinase n=1 Tax=Chryseobacterium sp. CBSDS_008 TaxID=3415265 RepID=UPI003CF2587E